MAQNATIYKAQLQIADMDRPYYGSHALTIARHPSETDERMMARVLAFALHAHEHLVLGKGISSEDEPDLWQKDLTGAVETWIDLGQPDEKRVRKACNRAKQVVVYNYGGRGSDVWWDQNRATLERLFNLTVVNIALASSKALTAFAQRTMHLQCTIQDGQVWVANEERVVEVELDPRKVV
jgi:uncharacterized protein YaeQ